MPKLGGAKQRQIVVTVDEELHRAAKVKAAMTGKPMAEVMREALQRWVQDDQPKAK